MRVKGNRATSLEQRTYHRAFHEEKSLAEIAAADQVSIQAVKQRLYRARRRGVPFPSLRVPSVTLPLLSLDAIQEKQIAGTN